ncbi:MAG: hypothetical protein IKD37_09080 [Clostridia bacterium]|nr:hypothetical protein [Clostridia bacterium]
MKYIERIKSILFIGLFVSAVTLAGIYIVGLPRGTDASANALPADVMAAMRGSTGGAASALLDDQLRPDFLGIKQVGQPMVGLLAEPALTDDLDDQLAHWVAFALGEGARSEVLEPGAGAARWADCLAADAYFYLSWRFAVPASVLRAHSLPDRTDAMLETAEGPLPRIKEIFFFPDLLSGGVCAVSCDGEGQITCWYRTPKAEDALPSFADFAIYLSRGVLEEYAFAGQLDADCPDSLLTLPVPAQPLTMADLSVSYPLAAHTNTARVSETVLTLFDYNLNKASGYYEADTDTAVFVETHGTLRATADSIVYEATAQGGLAVDDFVRKSKAALTLRDDIIACEALVARFRQQERDLLGGAAEPQLSAVYTEGNALVLEYVYVYHNIVVRRDAPALRLTVRAHRIVSAAVSACTYRTDETNSRVGSQQWMRNLAAYLARQESGTRHTVSLVYGAYASDPARLRADWVLEEN